MKLNKNNSQNNVARALQAFNGLRKILVSLENPGDDMNLSKPDLIAINFIFQKNELIMSELSKELNIGDSTATGIIDRLVEKRLVLRKNDQEDRRIVRVRLTKSGEQKAMNYQKQMKISFEKILALLTQEEQQIFILILEKIAKEQL